MILQGDTDKHLSKIYLPAATPHLYASVVSARAAHNLLLQLCAGNLCCSLQGMVCDEYLFI